MEKHVIPLGKTGKEVVLYREEERSTAMVTIDGRELSLELRTRGATPEQRLAAEKRLVRAGAKTLMMWDLHGVIRPTAEQAQARYPNDGDYWRAWHSWEAKHPWEMPR